MRQFEMHPKKQKPLLFETNMLPLRCQMRILLNFPPVPVGRHPAIANMKKVEAVIEKASDRGYGIYCPDLKGVALY
jgi:hypothetical protein